MRIFDIEASSNAIMIYLFMAGMPEDFNPAVTYMMKKVNLSRNTVKKALRELIECNVIRVTKSYKIGKYIQEYEFLEPNYYKKRNNGEDENES